MATDDGPIFFYKEDEPAYGFLCQFYPCTFVNSQDSEAYADKVHQADLHTFNCAEQYMMYHKSLVIAMSDKKVDPQTVSQRQDLPAAILASQKPRQQKSLARSIAFTKAQGDLWDKTKIDVVVEGNYNKFGQNPELKGKLLATGTRELVEASPRDRIWGIGFEAKEARAHVHRARWGANLLGKALMTARERLRSEALAREGIANDGGDSKADEGEQPSS